MPRNVRNFWIEARIDGRKEILSGGPVSKDGGFSLEISMRKDGDIIVPVILEGYSDGNTLRLKIRDTSQNGEATWIETKR